MKVAKLAVVLASVVWLSGCATVATPTPGLLFTSVQGPVNFGEGTDTAKQGRSCANNILGLFATGNASIEAAKADGDISRVTTVDHQSTTVLGLYGQFCTIAYGE